MSKYLGAGANYGIFEKQLLTTDGFTTQFSLIYQVGHPSSILVVSDGVLQEPNVSYSISEGGKKIVFSYPPLALERIYIVYLGRELSVPAVAGNYPLRFRLQAPVLNGTATDFDLSSLLPPDLGMLREESLIVFQNGSEKLFGVDWTLNVAPDFKVGNILKFTSAPSAFSTVDLYIHGTERSDILTVDPQSITGDKLANNITIGSSSNKCEAIYVKNLYVDSAVSYVNTSHIDIKTHSGFPNSNSNIKTNALATTTAAPTTIWDYTLPSDNSAIWFEINLIGLNITSEENAWITIKGGAKRNAGVAELIGIQQNTSGTDTSDYAAYAVVSGTNLQIKVVGHPTNTVHWAATISYQGITSVAL